MASIRTLGPCKHLRAERNQTILHYRKGRLVRSGAGIAFWFNPYTAAIAQLPVDDCETTFLLEERTRDHQQVTVQLTLHYRVTSPEKAAERVNFTIGLESGRWLEDPLTRLATLWQQRAQEPARQFIASVDLIQVLQSGPEIISRRIQEALQEDSTMSSMGLELTGLQVDRVTSIPELEKALQTPAREQMQQKADEAMFARRALAVENERAIKQNELETEIELAKQNELLIRKESENALLRVRGDAEAAREQTLAEQERARIDTEAYVEQQSLRAESDAAAERVLSAARADGEELRLEAWSGAPTRVLISLALQELAKNVKGIQHLNVTPNMLGDAFQQFFTEQN